MLFNSPEFIFAFLPFTLAGFYLTGTMSRIWALRWLILASAAFYAWWRPLNVLIIAPSILVNFALARALAKLSEREDRIKQSRAILVLGIAFNVAFLAYFKYLDFAFGAINDAFGANLVLMHVVLPLGISFITFQKIAFLVDVHAGRVKSFTLQDYCLFVLFFPQLIAGPIVHYREMMPQFHAATCRFEKEKFAVGLTLFFFGLFKKVILADNIAALVSPIYDKAAAGAHVSLLLSWMAAVGFTLQIYFDFSGYTDMALGLGRFFGVRLPPNFNSPLKASNIIDFWLHWHMTLTRFLTAYIYNPIVLYLTRRRAAKGLPGFGGRNTTVPAFLQLLAFPILVTMFVSGVWHGAGYLFILWGLAHGVFLTINHAWRLIAQRLELTKRAHARSMRPVGWLLTMVAVSAAMVLFRSSNGTAAADLLKGMLGINGVALPQSIHQQVGALGSWLGRLGVTAEAWNGHDFIELMGWIVATMSVALFLPNTLELTARYEPAIGIKPDTATSSNFRRWLRWEPSLGWAAAMSIIAACAVSFLGGPSEFLYWQF